MKEIIYYPGFEVRDETWLKLAMLYFDCLRPIIPYTISPRERYISDTFLRVMEDTDLVRPYCPEYEEGMCASVLACEEFERFLQHPERYVGFFGPTYGERLVDKWKSPNNQNCTLFEGKYSYEFFRFCIENQIARQCYEGIKISSELAFVYMSFLADVISRHNELEMITDVKKYSTLLLADMRIGLNSHEILPTITNEISLAIPDGLCNIPIDTIINLRQANDFNTVRKEYVKQITKLIDSKEGKRPYGKLEDKLSCEKEYIKICEEVFNMIGSATLTTISVVSAIQERQPTDWLSVTASAYMNIKSISDGTRGISEYVKELQSKKLARKYIAKLRTLNGRYC